MADLEKAQIGGGSRSSWLARAWNLKKKGGKERKLDDTNWTIRTGRYKLDDTNWLEGTKGMNRAGLSGMEKRLAKELGIWQNKEGGKEGIIFVDTCFLSTCRGEGGGGVHELIFLVSKGFSLLLSFPPLLFHSIKGCLITIVVYSYGINGSWDIRGEIFDTLWV